MYVRGNMVSNLALLYRVGGPPPEIFRGRGEDRTQGIW